MRRLAPFQRSRRIAFFTMEIALHPEIHTYSGGLGVLAGDTARSCADLELPLVVVTLISRSGYLHQELDEKGRQVNYPNPWDPTQLAEPLGAKVALTIEGREVWVQPWLYLLEGATRNQLPILLLDTDLEENHQQDRLLTHHLYGGDKAYRLKQEMVLGIGGVRILRALGFEIGSHHMNEGHSALLALELLRRLGRRAKDSAGNMTYDTTPVRDRCIFTTHTPVEAGHDQFPYDLVDRVMGHFIEPEVLRDLAGEDRLNMTRLALNLSGYVNGVAKRHAEISHRLFPGYEVRAITNGVYHPAWTAPPFEEVYQEFHPDWRHQPEVLVQADRIDDEKIRAAHRQAKKALIEHVHEISGLALDPEVALIGFARRMTGYKRPALIFDDMERLLALHRRYPMQLVFAGKAHPNDTFGLKLIETLHARIRDLRGTMKVAFLPNYNIEKALLLVSGADIWLNTPQAPLEASGTSGMKAALNGVLNLSTLDGWWLEGWLEGVTGWAIGEREPSGHREKDAEALYDKLEKAVLPLYYENKAAWTRMMKSAIAKLAPYFNTHRMMRRYATEAYFW